MSPLLQERATPAAAHLLPLGEEQQQQQQLEREDSDSDSSGEEFNYPVCVLCWWWWVWPQRGSPSIVVCCVWLVLCVMSSVIEASV